MLLCGCKERKKIKWASNPVFDQVPPFLKWQLMFGLETCLSKINCFSNQKGEGTMSYSGCNELGDHEIYQK